jgi:hypothetical protein
MKFKNSSRNHGVALINKIDLIKIPKNTEFKNQTPVETMG